MTLEMASRSLGLYLLILSCACLALNPVSAQEIAGDIRGIVHDPSGAVVPAATVNAVNSDRNETMRSVTTGPDGSYVAPRATALLVLRQGRSFLQKHTSGDRAANGAKGVMCGAYTKCHWVLLEWRGQPLSPVGRG